MRKAAREQADSHTTQKGARRDQQMEEAAGGGGADSQAIGRGKKRSADREGGWRIRLTYYTEGQKEVSR